MFRQAASYLMANVVSAIFGLIMVVLFTRILGPAEYGVYIIGFGIATMTSALCFGWVKASIVPLTADGDTDLRLTAAMGLAGLGLLLVPIGYLAAHFFLPDLLPYVLPALFLALGIGFFEFYLETFRARQDISSYVWATIVRAAATLAILIALVLLFELGGMGLILGSGLAYLIATLLFSAVEWRRPVAPFEPAQLRALLAFGLPMTISGAIFLLQTMLDRFMVAGLLGEEAAGLYGAGADLVRQIIFFPGVAIGTAVAPIAILHFSRNDTIALDRHLSESTELLLAVVAPAIAGLALVAPQLAGLVLGAEFHAEVTTLIPVIALAWFFRTLSYQLLHVSFQMCKAPRLLLAQGGVTLALNAILLPILIPVHGLIGAAWSVAISEAAGMIFGLWLTRWAYPLSANYGAFTRVGLATLAMALPTHLVSSLTTNSVALDLALQVLTGVIFFSAAAIALNLVGIRERLGPQIAKMRPMLKRIPKP
jgi:O-antigen/teichoic acid export membrane protein